jgi:hypothetical protein
MQPGVLGFQVRAAGNIPIWKADREIADRDEAEAPEQ